MLFAWIADCASTFLRLTAHRASTEASLPRALRASLSNGVPGCSGVDVDWWVDGELKCRCHRVDSFGPPKESRASWVRPVLASTQALNDTALLLSPDSRPA
jgi:hypothetical protein